MNTVNESLRIILRDLGILTFTDSMVNRATTLASYDGVKLRKIVSQPPSFLDRSALVLPRHRHKSKSTTVQLSLNKLHLRNVLSDQRVAPIIAAIRPFNNNLAFAAEKSTDG